MSLRLVTGLIFAAIFMNVRSGCDIDEALIECLVKVIQMESIPEDDKLTAKGFGNLFFNVIHLPCLEHAFPLFCVKKESEGRCNQCQNDTNQTKVWQHVEGPTFPLN